ncbi:bax inhibitor 1-like [Solanum tuberosum]|uniref:bax inhibitor 1-like n=1 Tax=Solanum tuberosum TaxID=4113 RepID=UPI00073A5010|nr:PREDICTED: bax inhibitor 1-like [Solanum tuberosum]
MNAVKAYFNRNWTREDLMNTGEISEYAYTSLTTVYLTLFCAMLSFTFGSFLQLIIWEVGGLFTVLSSVASLLCITIESEAEGLTIDVCSLYLGCFFWPFYQISLRNLSTPYCQPFGRFNI